VLQHFWFLLRRRPSCILFLRLLSWLRPFVFLFSSSRQILGLCLALDENSFLYSILNITTTSSFELFFISTLCHSTKRRYVLKGIEDGVTFTTKANQQQSLFFESKCETPNTCFTHVFSPFALTTPSNLYNLLICAPTFSLSCFLAAWFLFINTHYFMEV